jgi:hypothetical protein
VGHSPSNKICPNKSCPTCDDYRSHVGLDFSPGIEKPNSLKFRVLCFMPIERRSRKVKKVEKVKGVIEFFVLGVYTLPTILALGLFDLLDCSPPRLLASATF